MPQANPALNTAAPLQIFKPGRHTAMSGQALAFSESDLQATVAAYDPAKHEAPLVVGHPAHDMPAYGWVQALQFNEGGIDATPAQVNTDFADMVAAGAFKKISASFYSPNSPANPVPGVYYLRHVGFLGAQAPAVKGMRSPSFADSEEGIVTFEFSESNPKETTVTPEERAALEAENTRLRAELAQNIANQTHAANLAFCEGLPGVLPAWRAVAVATLDHLAAQPTVVEFGEGDAKAPLADQFKAMLAALPAAVQFSESATTQRAAGGADASSVEFAAPEGFVADPNSLALYGKAVAFQKTNGGAWIDAVKAVS
jgi:hypothetical protein